MEFELDLHDANTVVRAGLRLKSRAAIKLPRAGFRIVRVSAELVLSDLAAAVALVRAAL